MRSLLLTLLFAPVIAFGQTVTGIPNLQAISGALADGDLFPVHDLSAGGTNVRKVSALTMQAYFTSDTAFAASWNGVTGIAPSKNAVYDKFHLFDTDDNGTIDLIGDASGTALALTGTLTAYYNTAIPAGGTTGSGLLFSSAENFGVFFGSGAPTLTAARGSLYLRSEGPPSYENNGWLELAVPANINGDGDIQVYASGRLEAENNFSIDPASKLLTLPGSIALVSGSVLNWAGSDILLTHSANALTISGGDFFVPTEIYDATGWNGDLSVPTKDAVRDKIESLSLSGSFGETSLSTLANNQVLWDGANASRTLTFNVSGTDSVITVSSGVINVSTGAFQVGGSAVLVSGGSAGTPSSITLTNGTGLPISGIASLGTGVGTWLATPSGANLASALTTALPASKGGTGLTSLGTNVTGLLGADLTDPNVDRILFWDDSASGFAYLTAGTGLSISGTTISVGDLSATYQPLASSLTSWAAVTRASGFDTFTTTPSGANFVSLLTSGLTTAGIADNAITGAKIAMGSDASGDILYYNGTDYIRLAKGSDGTVLKLSAGIPAWGTDNTAGSPTWDTLGDASGNGDVSFGTTSQSISSTLDSGIVLELTNTDADAAADTVLMKLSHNDGADANVIYLRMTGDKDGTPTNDYDFTQSGFTSLLPINPPAEAYDTTGWNSDTGAAQKDAIRDQLVIGDTDGDGKIDVLDVVSTAGFLSVSSTGVPVEGRTLTEGLALDITNGTGAAGNPTFAFDPTELTGSRTFGDASTDTIVWTFDRATGTDPTITFNSGSIGLQALTLGTPLAVAQGGTGLASGTSGGILAFTASGTLASSGALAANALVIGGGAGVAPSTTTTGTGVLTALGNTTNATGGVLTTDGTASPTGKTYDASATGNVLKLKGYIYLSHPHIADGTGATIGTTATSAKYGHATFSNSADKLANYVEYYLQVPEDIDTSVALRGRLKVLLSEGADTNDQNWLISSVSVADSAVLASSTLANETALDYTADASGASGDIETTAWTTLTSWAGALTAGQTWRIRLMRDGDTSDASTVSSTELGLVIEYGISQ